MRATWSTIAYWAVGCHGFAGFVGAVDPRGEVAICAGLDCFAAGGGAVSDGSVAGRMVAKGWIDCEQSCRAARLTSRDEPPSPREIRSIVNAATLGIEGARWGQPRLYVHFGMSRSDTIV
jgi:hypothetical protein